MSISFLRVSADKVSLSYSRGTQTYFINRADHQEVKKRMMKNI